MNANLESAVLVDARMDGADLTKASLMRTNLSRAFLPHTNLTEAKLNFGNFSGSNLHSAVLTQANLSNASFSFTNLIAADLTDAKLDSTVLISANLTDANLTRAQFYCTAFGATVLRGAQGLESCSHNWASYLDHLTLLQSGHLPRAFLRGCGVSDQLIDYLPSLLNEAIQFYSCFISYSTINEEFANRLYADLQSKGVRCWFAPHDIQGGKKINEQIDEAIRRYDKLLLILSDASMESEWVRTEIANARQKEIEAKRQVLFPISLVDYAKIRQWKNFDADTGKDSAREIREYFIPDFSNWKNHDLYQKAFEQLLKDLKAEQSAPEQS
jgi:hypothetical protein